MNSIKDTYIVTAIIIVIAIIAWQAILTPLAKYTIEYWVSFHKNERVEMPYIVNTGAGLIFPVVIIGSIGTKICDVAKIPKDHIYHMPTDSTSTEIY